MSVIKGRLVISTTHAYFHDLTPITEDCDRHDFKVGHESIINNIYKLTILMTDMNAKDTKKLNRLVLVDIFQFEIIFVRSINSISTMYM